MVLSVALRSGLLHNLSGVFTKVPSYGNYRGFQTPGSCVHRETRTNMEMALDNLSSAQKDELMSQVKQQIALANAQELLTKMTEKCFKKCISKPGTELDSSEQKCIAMCMDRYMDSWNLVSRTYTMRIQKEQYKG
ncbi:mitochondrial import inner membrane translocase subunit Tim13 [Culex quinquefasciatus]|uniref:mitochondrial import inner membrane translocase subunit Tim13 n=1 Tax=Culex quinquefasciatus TaxID=7176 RepID=UPI0018E2AB04|nr:mitochondrial import inner membrane translocase subunit Tim13 [Culex quinquefasciatus]